MSLELLLRIRKEMLTQRRQERPKPRKRDRRILRPKMAVAIDVEPDNNLPNNEYMEYYGPDNKRFDGVSSTGALCKCYGLLLNGAVQISDQALLFGRAGDAGWEQLQFPHGELFAAEKGRDIRL